MEPTTRLAGARVAVKSRDACDSGHVELAPFGAVLYQDGLQGDRLLASSAEELKSQGFRLGGVVQTNAYRSGQRKCDMFLTDLSSGELIQISQNRGNEARGCRLDSSGLARACALGSAALADGIDLFILNKFGKEEVEGRGFRSIIAEALMAGVPVLVGVSALNVERLLEFAGGGAALLPPDRAAVREWTLAAIRSRVVNGGRA